MVRLLTSLGTLPRFTATDSHELHAESMRAGRLVEAVKFPPRPRLGGPPSISVGEGLREKEGEKEREEEEEEEEEGKEEDGSKIGDCRWK